MQKWLQPPACSDRILSSYWLVHFHLMKKSAKVADGGKGAALLSNRYFILQLYFGSDCGVMGFFTDEPQSKEQLISLPHLWNTVRRKDRGLSTCKPWTEQAEGLEAFLHEVAQNFEVVFNIQNWNSKIQNKAYPMVALSCRSNLAGWYL